MLRKHRRNVGVIGLGIIGSRVAAALRASGFQVFVWSRTPRAEPNFLGSPAQVADLCDVIQLFVSDGQALFETIDKLGDHLTSRHIVVCNATVGPEATVEAARRVRERGAHFLDAPFTGSRDAAENRALVYYIGGDDDVLSRAEPVLKASSKAIVKIGDVGQAATVKIATNMLVAVTTQTLAEALAVVKRSGADPSVLTAALEHHGVRSGLSDMKLPKMLTGDFEPHFALRHMFKDVQLAIHIANSLDLDIPATTATAGVMYGALNRGWADADFSAIAQAYAPAEPEPPAEPVKATSAPLPPPQAEPEPAKVAPAPEAVPSQSPPEPAQAPVPPIAASPAPSQNAPLPQPDTAAPVPPPAPDQSPAAAQVPAQDRNPAAAQVPAAASETLVPSQPKPESPPPEAPKPTPAPAQEAAGASEAAASKPATALEPKRAKPLADLKLPERPALAEPPLVPLPPVPPAPDTTEPKDPEPKDQDEQRPPHLFRRLFGAR